MQMLMIIVFFGLCGIFLAFIFSKITQKYERDSKIINFKMLTNACFDDQTQALKLVKAEKEQDNTISDEEAASRALNKLVNESRIARQDHANTKQKTYSNISVQ